MRLSLKYGNEERNVFIPDKNYLGTLRPQRISGVKNPEKEIERALHHPVGSPRLKELVSSKDTVVILVSDISRPSPSNLILPPVLKELNEAGVPSQKITIVFGLGIHRNQTEDEKKALLGKSIYSRFRCIEHDPAKCIHLGETKQGTPIEVFKEVVEASFVTATGNIEYHYYAGFSGGAKALAPGVCSRQTIEQNHKKFLAPGARPGEIRGNPIREELEEIAQKVGVDFMVNVVLNPEKQVIKAVAGDVTKAHRQGASFLDQISRDYVQDKADIVVVSPGGFPRDIDLYQTHKAMEHALPALKDGGILITVGQCRDGLGIKPFAQVFDEGKSPHELVNELKTRFVQGRHVASRIAHIHLNTEIFLVSDLSEDIEDKLFFKNFESVDEALSLALDKKGRDAQVLVMPYGISTLPFVG
ncbi:MAG TPA: nickel-dependent lactate racemase [Acidobacteriota bacterium]|nr:nickel-dependent lactate racemase [Acidobacteriota bacterium]